MGKIAATISRLAGQRVYIDTNVFIYFLDQHDTYFEVVSRLFKACANQEIFGTTGDAAVAEVMIGPYRQDNPALASRFKRFFAQKNFISILGHDRDIFDAAAMLVARNRMKFIDALHVATAVNGGCHFFLTNDAGIKSSADIEVITLAELL
jgi:predicted nucleic acid-binding protein